MNFQQSLKRHININNLKKDKSFLNKINFNFNKTNLSEEYIEEYLKERDKKINEAVKNNDLSILTNFIDNYENDNPFK